MMEKGISGAYTHTVSQMYIHICLANSAANHPEIIYSIMTGILVYL